MPSKKWSLLNTQQLGRYAEQYAFMEFLSYGLDVYPTEVDDHGVDLIIKDKKGSFREVQVKSVRNWSYVFIKNQYIEAANKKKDGSYLICYMNFEDGQLPQMFLFSSAVWRNPNGVFKDRPYEYGISVCKKNRCLLDPYVFEKQIVDLL